MPIDLNHSLNTISEQAFGNNIISGTLGNVMSCALIIAIIAIVLIMFIYPAKSGTPLLVVVKIFIYMFAATAALIFIHDGIKRRHQTDGDRDADHLNLVTQSNPENRDVVYQQADHVIRPAAPAPEPTVVQQITIQAPAELPKYTSDRIMGGGQYSQMGIRVPQPHGNPYNWSR